MKTRALTATEVLALPAMPTAQDAFAALGISGDLGYQLIRDNEFPVEVIKLGARALRVRRSELLNFLGLTEENGASPVYQPGEPAGNSEAAGYQPAAPNEQSAPTCK
ncbi:DNA-binding protein [Streptomyces ipomoeae]|uniref:helix-turn-helix transcriptional regulator n=1 Tax=Streptomyces ipomoeae TaxID=103232 RepID=UPI0029A4922C|nr:DNA-binding protein [Streptomyces ipomoeae]MDX2839487.1 DNA-binding protein [Streptomyces ipomoeae]